MSTSEVPLQQQKKELPPLRELPFMTPWYGPKALAQTGLRDFISRVFGSYADQRIMQAAVDVIPPDILVRRYDYSEPNPEDVNQRVEQDAEGALWIDYCADTGDGFDSTYAVASMLAAETLEVTTPTGETQSLPAGRILLLGGDQAYPYASITEYKRRFLTPFGLTTWHENPATAPLRRKMFILPGNHDWYDGLAAFDELFCSRRDGVSKGRVIGPWQCRQHRSYWAIQLPDNWWIWGLDIQLTASVDVGQIQYFNAVSQHMENVGGQPNIVLCIATPSWHLGAETGSFEAYSGNLQRILNVAFEKGRVCAVVAGDDHHYARYFNKDHRLNLITSGGGGAYLAPTHQLHRDIEVPWMTMPGGTPHRLRFTTHGSPSTDDASVANERRAPRPESLFPRRRVSRRLAWLTLLFGLWNPSFCLGLGIFYWLMYWFYTTAEVRPLGAPPESLKVPIVTALRDGGFGLEWTDRIYYMLAAGQAQPMFAGFALLIWVMLYFFLAGSKRRVLRVIEATAHWMLHMLAMSLLVQVILLSNLGKLLGSDVFRVTANSVAMIAMGSVVAGLIISIYLFFGCRVFKTHADNGFSSIRIAGYKNFLRFRITKDSLTIYPIGLVRVPSRAGWREPAAEERKAGIVAGYVPRLKMKPRLIEGPIVIRPSDIKDIE
jgi:hypothetical protein